MAIRHGRRGGGGRAGGGSATDERASALATVLNAAQRAVDNVRRSRLRSGVNRHRRQDGCAVERLRRTRQVLGRLRGRHRASGTGRGARPVKVAGCRRRRRAAGISAATAANATRNPSPDDRPGHEEHLADADHVAGDPGEAHRQDARRRHRRRGWPAITRPRSLSASTAGGSSPTAAWSGTMNQPIMNIRTRSCQIAPTVPASAIVIAIAAHPDRDDRARRNRRAMHRDQGRGEDHRRALGHLDRAEPDRPDLEDADDERDEQDVDGAEPEHRDGEGE